MRIRLHPWSLTALLLVVPVSVLAQDKSTYYTVTHPRESTIDWKAFYDKADELTAATRKELPHHLDLAYGDDPKQKLDVYLPKGRVTKAPVFVFLHGGGMREGDRAHYGYVARPFAKHGIVTVAASYRLTPRFHYPDQPNDVRHVLAWVFRSVERYGGDPNRIFLGGHSAGATLTATVCAKTDWLTRMVLPQGLLKGCAPISGSYDVRNAESRESWRLYVPDPALRDEASPLLTIVDPPSFVVLLGSREAERLLLVGAPELVEKIRQKRAKAELIVLDGMEHDDTVFALGEEQSPVFQAILKMIGSTRAGSDN